MKKLLLISLFLIAFLERTVFDLGPNVELVTTVMIFTSFYFGKKESSWLTLTVLILSDFIIGNTSIFLFTWTGFLIPALLSKNLINRSTQLTNQLLLKSKISSLLDKLFSLTSTGLISNLFFFIWTNFGVWLLDSWEMYTKDLNGFIKCYINALPFLKNQILSSLIFIPLTLITISAAKHLYPKIALYLNTNKNLKEA